MIGLQSKQTDHYHGKGGESREDTTLSTVTGKPLCPREYS